MQVNKIKKKQQPIGGLMLSVFSSNAIDRGFESLLAQTKDCKIDIYCFSAKHASLGIRAKTGWPGIRIMVTSRATCLPADCRFSELALYNSH